MGCKAGAGRELCWGGLVARRAAAQLSRLLFLTCLLQEAPAGEQEEAGSFYQCF